MNQQLLSVNLDFSQLQQIIKTTIAEEMAKHSFVNNLPYMINRSKLKEILGIGETKATEIMNRADFPVCREFGNPLIPRDLFVRWVEQHTEWIDKNASDSIFRRNDVA
ncbi:DNA-binding protein [Paenibacillus sp. NRS-1760]|uniref:DNA-binding protein n=1 Tax=Paenibacillus sp. NRS-1760 TaxID=3233902 RepID=UPI003D2B3207